MLPSQVPVKTAKGLEEIEKRTYGLLASLRLVLIMVNGRLTVTDLAKKLAGFGEIESALAQLEQDGFVAAKPDSNEIVTPSKPAIQKDTPNSHPEFNMEKAKGFIRFVLLGAMGPTAERRINRIEATTTTEELRVELDAIHDMLPKVLSKREAQQAWNQLQPIMTSIAGPPV